MSLSTFFKKKNKKFEPVKIITKCKYSKEEAPWSETFKCDTYVQFTIKSKEGMDIDFNNQLCNRCDERLNVFYMSLYFPEFSG